MKRAIYIISILILTHTNSVIAAGKCSATKLAETQHKVAAVMKADGPKISGPWKNLKKAFNGNRDCMAIFESYDFG